MDTGSRPVGSTRRRLRFGYNPESSSTKSTLSGGLNRIHDEIPLAWDEIRLDGGWVDLISSEALAEDFIQTRLDFILQSRISFLLLLNFLILISDKFVLFWIFIKNHIDFLLNL